MNAPASSPRSGALLRLALFIVLLIALWTAARLLGSSPQPRDAPQEVRARANLG